MRRVHASQTETHQSAVLIIVRGVKEQRVAHHKGGRLTAFGVDLAPQMTDQIGLGPRGEREQESYKDEEDLHIMGHGKEWWFCFLCLEKR